LIRVLTPKEFLRAINSNRIRGDMIRLRISNVTIESSDKGMSNALGKTFKYRLFSKTAPILLVYERSVYQKNTIGISGNTILLTDLVAKVYKKFNPYSSIKLQKSTPCIFTPTKSKVIIAMIRTPNIDFTEYYKQYLTLAYSIHFLNRLDLETFLDSFKKQNKVLIELPIKNYSTIEELHTGKLARAIRTKEIDLKELNRMTYLDAYEFLMKRFRSIRLLSVETRMRYFFNAYFNEDREYVPLKSLF